MYCKYDQISRTCDQNIGKMTRYSENVIRSAGNVTSETFSWKSFYWLIKLFVQYYSVICRPTDHTERRPRPGLRFEPGPGSPEAGTLPLDHLTSLTSETCMVVFLQTLHDQNAPDDYETVCEPWRNKWSGPGGWIWFTTLTGIGCVHRLLIHWRWEKEIQLYSSGTTFESRQGRHGLRHRPLK